MLSPTRSSSQALLKNVVTTVAGALRDSASASTSIEHEEESNDADDQEPSKKKFKDDAESELETSVTTEPRRERPPKKRKVCISFGYCGAGYFGLQRNAKDKVHRTIEDELVEAFVKVDAIPQFHADDMSKMGFQRAARTDKGVSAVANLISLKCVPMTNLTELVNEQLPKQIRMFGIKRVAASFNSKNSCDARTYIYILPTYAFCPIEEMTSESYRVTPEVLQLVREVASEYLGSHNFHNFTSGKKFTDPSARRHIFSVDVVEPYMRENVEFTTITIKGQSFMLHQIRKMISLVIAIVRGIASRDTIQQAYKADKIDIPKAPPLGLVLQKLHYDRYDRKFGNDGHHESLTWEEEEPTIVAFKEDVIIPHIVKKEITEKSMLAYLERLLMHTFSPITSELDWRLSFPYQIAFQKVRTKMNPMVRQTSTFAFFSLLTRSPPRDSLLAVRSHSFVFLLNSAFIHMFSWLFFGPMLSRYDHSSPYFSIVTYVIPTLLGRLRHLPFVQKMLDNAFIHEPFYPPGAYTGVGRGLYLLQQQQESAGKFDEDEDDQGADE